MSTSPPTYAERLLTVIQALAILVGGCWVVARYLDHERESLALGVEQQRLTNSQMRSLANTQRQAEILRVEQLKLSNSQAQLALATQKQSQTLGLQQQALANEQARLALRLGTLQERLQGQQLAAEEIELAKGVHALSYSTGSRFAREFSIAPKRLGESRNGFTEYQVAYDWEFTNTSEVDLEISFFILDHYVGAMRAVSPNHSIIQSLGTPSNRWNPTGAQPGAIDWRKVNSTGSLLVQSSSRIESPWDWVMSEVPLAWGGPGVGIMRPSEKIAHGGTYIARVESDVRFIGFMVNVCFNRCTASADLYYRFDWADLGAALPIARDRDGPASENAPTADRPPNLGGAAGWRRRSPRRMLGSTRSVTGYDEPGENSGS